MCVQPTTPQNQSLMIVNDMLILRCWAGHTWLGPFLSCNGHETDTKNTARSAALFYSTTNKHHRSILRSSIPTLKSWFLFGSRSIKVDDNPQDTNLSGLMSHVENTLFGV